MLAYSHGGESRDEERRIQAQECWSVGGLECWSAGVLEYWSVGVLEYWRIQSLRVTRYGLRVILFNSQLETRNSQQPPIT